MTLGYRGIFGYAGEPVQQSMTEHGADYTHKNNFKMKLGVILTVYTADSIYNTSALSTAVGRGCRHECTVQIIEDGIGNYSKLDHVVIPPSAPSGVDNYYEALPRGSSQTINVGSVFDPNVQLMDPYDCDGDWCIVAFVGGEQDYPFIVSWWPSPRNFADPQTTGPGTLNTNTQGFVLDQSNRLFRRVNGTELTITKAGDIYLDTSTAGEPVVFGLPPVKGKTARAPSTTGGSFRGVLKPTASLELDWNIPQDGEGLGQTPDPQIPQSNPATTPQGNTFAPVQKLSTFLKVDAAVFDLMVPTEIKMKSNSMVELESQGNMNLLSPSITMGGRSTTCTIDTVTLNIDSDETAFNTTGEYSNLSDAAMFDTNFFSVDSTADVSISGSNLVSIEGTNSRITGTAEISLSAPQIILGPGGAELPLLNQSVATAFSAAVAALVPPIGVPTPASNAASITSIIAVLNLLNGALQNGQTLITKAS